jgi:hypothetical protein
VQSFSDKYPDYDKFLNKRSVSDTYYIDDDDNESQ